ncbi:MAG: HNH endonuclease [Desulfobulbaceae bacterium DB1]|nr:MAG: HNH endonuclease [Desulfobulbaceae bacterium DB1]
MMDDYGFIGIDEGLIKKEKAKARDLRKSRWWQNRIAEGICYYCKRKFPPAELTMDHLQPLSRGGKSSKGNLVPACKECNNKKRQMLPLEWQEYLDVFKDEK